MNALTYGIKITVESTGKSYHTLDDWGLALGNNDYIGDPEMETTYINVPYRTGLIDASELVTGRPIYKKRQLSFYLGGLRERLNWDAVISNIRNLIHGQLVRVTVDNDKAYFWKGRIYVEDFDRNNRLGEFTLSMPTADPYKYDIVSSAEPWLWDPFNFETGIIYYDGGTVINGSGTVTILHGHMLTNPQIVISEMTSSTLTVEYNGRTFELTSGTNIIPQIMVGGDTDVELLFTGDATVQVVYRGGSL